MRASGNNSQWTSDYPGIDDIRNDISSEVLYVLEDENRGLVGVFAFIEGEDPTYKVIEDGKWLNEDPYGTIHRIASNGMVPDILKNAVTFCLGKTPNVRIDTHSDNSPMLRALRRLGFRRCGVIYCRDGSPREAFQFC